MRVYQSIRHGNEFSLDQMRDNIAAWSVPFRRELQRMLRKEGYYSSATLTIRWGQARHGRWKACSTPARASSDRSEARIDQMMRQEQQARAPI